MTALALVLLGVAALGLWLVPSTPRLARAAAWLLLLAFAVPLASASRRTVVVEPARPVAVELPGEFGAAATALLAGASRCGPRAEELACAWRVPLAFDWWPPSRALGAVVVAPPPLRFEPSAVVVRRTTQAERDRPLGLRVEAPPFAETLVAELFVTAVGAATPWWREDLRLGSAPVELSGVPEVAGEHRLQLRVHLPGRTLELHGVLQVGSPPPLLVLEPSGIAARALAAQGVAVRVVDALPDDWQRHPGLLLGAPVSSAVQQELAAGVLDGFGLFVLAPGFGVEGDPLRALLPLRVLPEEPGSDGPEGADGSSSREPSTAPPPPVESPPEPTPPIGDTRDAQPVSDEPVDVDKHAIAMVLVVDRSGSMGALLPNGRSKMSYAKTSALRTAEALDEGDRVGVVTFGNKGAGQVELRLTTATDRVAVGAGIERLAHAAERTYLLSGLRLAHEMLGPADAAVKHMVVITDGEFDSDELPALRYEAARMRAGSHVTVSIISIVDQATDPEFAKNAELLSRDGGGRFLMVDDARSVPVFVSAEVTRALSRIGRKPRSPVGEGGDGVASAPAPPKPPEPIPPAPSPPTAVPEPTPDEPPATRLGVRAVADSPLLEPYPGTWPSLGGARAATAPLDAQVLLVAGDDGQPLLAFANRGLGRVGAFAADLGGGDGAEFRAAAAFPAWLAQWVASIAPVQPMLVPPRIDASREVAPPAPRPAEIELLGALGAGPVRTEWEPPAPVERPRRVEPSPEMAPWLLLWVLSFAAVERLLVGLRLRRPT